MSFRLKDLLRLVKGDGESLVLSKTTTKGTYNPATGQVDNPASTPYPFVGYFYNQLKGVGDMGSYQFGQLMCVIPNDSLPVKPNDNDQITGPYGTYNITNVKAIDSKGTPVCYLCSIAT